MKNFNRKIQFSLVVICFLLLGVGFVQSVGAQEVIPRIGVSPHTFDLQVLPGEVIEQKIKIFNQSEFPIPITARATDFTAEDETGQMLFDESSQDISFASRFWFKIENPDFILDPGEIEEVRFQIEVPDNAEPGGHYAVILFEPRLPSFYFKEEAIVRNIPEIGVLFLTSVKKFTLEPESGRKLEIVEFSLSKEKRLVGLENFISRFTAAIIGITDVKIVESSHLNFILRIKNNDIYHIKPSGRILIYNSFNKKVGDIKVPKRTILPGKSRVFPAEFKPEIPERLKWLPASIANFLVQNFFIGKYRARLELIAESPVSTELFSLTVPTALTFFSLPWKFWGSVILIFSAIVLFSLKYRTRIKKAARVLFSRQRIK